MRNQKSNEDLFLEASAAWEKRQYKKAFELFLEASEKGDSSAQNNLGYFYDEGIYVPRNINKAIYWYKKAYNQGDGSPATNIAIYYRSIKEYKKALWWFHRAVKLKDHDSYYDLGQMYENGQGVKKNIPKAIQFYKKAVNARHITEDTVEKSKKRIEILKT